MTNTTPKMTATEALAILNNLATEGMICAAIVNYDRDELEAFARNMLATVEILAKRTQTDICAEHLEQPSTTDFDPKIEPLRIGDHVSDLDESETGIVIAVNATGSPSVAWKNWHGDTMLRSSVRLEAWSRLPPAERKLARARAWLERPGNEPDHQAAA
ncbi:MAG: hypothetical protein KAX47_01555 [Zoogloea sp.]|jgi:hypothetical protein|nr:hypothetical protein [Zoogloea sp.]